MKIAFIVQGFETMASEILAAMAKREGHQFRLFIDPGLFNDGFFQNPYLAKLLDERKAVLSRVVRWGPDVIGMSVLSDTYPWVHEMARLIKRTYPAPIIMGGDHATAVPHALIEDPHVDYVVQGEGEYPFIELLARIENGVEPDDVANVWFKRNGEIISSPLRPLIRDLDSLPFSDKSIYDHTFVKKMGIFLIMASRGCPYRCAYCSESMLKRIYSSEKGSYWRPRSVDNVIEELEIGKREGRVKYVNFFDPIFGADIRWLRDFVPKYREKIGAPFTISAHPAHVTEEYAELVKEAGCVKVDLGVQSVDPETRKNLLHRSDSNEQVVNAIDRIMKAGIYLHTGNICNLPGQTEEHLRELARFYNRHRPNTVLVYGLRLLPGTDLEKTAVDMGVVEKDFMGKNARCKTSFRAIYRGGQWPTNELFRFQLLLSLIPILPPNLVDAILDRKIYNWFPKNPAYLTLFLRTVTAQKWKDDIARRSYIGGYRFYLAKKLKSAVFGRSGDET